MDSRRISWAVLMVFASTSALLAQSSISGDRITMEFLDEQGVPAADLVRILGQTLDPRVAEVKASSELRAKLDRTRIRLDGSISFPREAGTLAINAILYQCGVRVAVRTTPRRVLEVVPTDCSGWEIKNGRTSFVLRDEVFEKDRSITDIVLTVHRLAHMTPAAARPLLPPHEFRGLDSDGSRGSGCCSSRGRCT